MYYDLRTELADKVISRALQKTCTVGKNKQKCRTLMLEFRERVGTSSTPLNADTLKSCYFLLILNCVILFYPFAFIDKAIKINFFFFFSHFLMQLLAKQV